MGQTGYDTETARKQTPDATKGVGMAEWYWCLDHGAAEEASSDCPPDRRMGPYPSRDAAEHWKDRVDSRNDKWDADDASWSGDEQPQG
ncbi:MAG: hypothetical protein NVS3B12_34840 [Acidimicrobiales bacterium]